MPTLRLFPASRVRIDESIGRFRAFIDANPNPFVVSRSSDVLAAAITETSLFFVENDAGELIAITGFYYHGSPSNAWGELGSTLVNKTYRGIQLQRTIYNHILAYKRLADWPGRVFAIVDELAQSSNENVERCGFAQQPGVPSELQEVCPGDRWNPVFTGKKRFYCLQRKGLIEALLFVAARGHMHDLLKWDGSTPYQLQVDLNYLREPGVRKALELEALELGKILPTSSRFGSCDC
jgi:hypothetical protein